MMMMRKTEDEEFLVGNDFIALVFRPPCTVLLNLVYFIEAIGIIIIIIIIFMCSPA